MNGLIIEDIQPNSPAFHAGLQAGDRLLTINGQPVRDLIDYTWLSSDNPLTCTIQRNGESLSVVIEQDPYEGIGLFFTPPPPRRCGNNCLFCFVHQLPPGLRKPLYIKDEDYRLSFLEGTYVTLSTTKPDELQRIIDQRLSPIYVSVHAVQPAIRERLLGRRGIPPIMDQIQQLCSNGIELHTQVVLCPGINDGEVLEETIETLAAFSPMIRSLAVVPVGLTAHREKLPPLSSVDTAYAQAFLDRFVPIMRRLNRKLGEPFLQLADEFFLKAERPFPALASYGELPQWENGVGMVPWFRSNAHRMMPQVRPCAPITLTAVTGTSAYPVVAPYLEQLAQKTSCDLSLVACPSLLFGGGVSVAGLVTGGDILAQLAGTTRGGILAIPSVMLKEGACFLDDLTPDQVADKLGMTAAIFEPSMSGLYRLIKTVHTNAGRTGGSHH